MNAPDRLTDPGHERAPGRPNTPLRLVDEDHDVPSRLHAELRARLGLGDRDGAIDFALRLRTHLNAPAQHVDGARAARLFLTLASEGLMYEGSLRALTDLNRAAGRAASVGERELEARALERIAVIHAAQGRLREARLVLAALVPKLPDPDGNAFTAAARALIAVEGLDRGAEELISSSALDDIPDPYWPLVLLGRARWQLARGGEAAALETAMVARTSRRIRPTSLAASTLLAIRADALSAMGDPATAAMSLHDPSEHITPELELARARAEIYLGSSLRALGVIRRLAASEDAGPSVRAEAMLLGLNPEQQHSAAFARTQRAVRALVEMEGIRRVMTAAPQDVAPVVWPNASVDVELRSVQAQPRRLRASEQRVLQALANDGGMTEVAERLRISKNTLKTHAQSIYRKLGVASRRDAVAQAYLRGLLDPAADGS